MKHSFLGGSEAQETYKDQEAQEILKTWGFLPMI